MEMEMEMVTNLVTALEKATIMAKQLPSSATPTDSANIYASLHAAHHHLSLFLAHTASKPDGDDAPMQLADEEQPLEDSKMPTVELVEERMKDCSIQNQKKKRPKRSLSPTSLAAGEPRRWLDYETQPARGEVDYDPHVAKLRALDLIYQFHC